MKYQSKNTGLNVISGKVKEVKDGLLVVEVTYFDKDGEHKEDVNVKSNFSETEGIKVGYNITAVGFRGGANTVNANKVMNGNDYFELEGAAIVTGFISDARLYEEKEEDGSPRLNKEGKPKKPHFDVTISVKQGDEYVSHRIKVYNSDNQPDAIEKVQKRLSGLNETKTKDGKEVETKIYATILTRPGDEYTSTRNGRTYRNVSHMGINKMDLERLFVEVKENTKPAPAVEEELSSGDGFMNIPDGIDEELPFN